MRSTLAAALCATLALGPALGSGLALAEDAAPPPPWLMTGADTVTVAATWAPEGVAAALPDGVVPVDDLSGGLNIYTAEGGFGISPYSAAYAYVNVKGWPSAIGAPARYILGGWYGPDPKVAAGMQTWFGAAVPPGDSAQAASGDNWTGTGGGTGVAGDGSIRLEITPTGECGPAAGTLNYVGPRGESKGLGLLKIPFTGSFCTAAAVSVDIEAPEGSTLAGLEVTSMLGGGQFKGASFAFAE